MPIDAWTCPPAGWPPQLWAVPYVRSAIPGSTEPPSWLDGSNCQRFAYGVLRLFGLDCLPLRSSELWSDKTFTAVVAAPEPLDLVLYNDTDDAYGAHVGVWMAPGEILHLSAEVGRPAIWPEEAFKQRPRYSTVVGYKRVAPASPCSSVSHRRR